MITCGVDEAGRGPVFGPMVIACCVFESGSVEELRKLDVRDSKKLTARRREVLEPVVKGLCVEFLIKKISSFEVDCLRERVSLNEGEAEAIAELILNLKSKPDKVFIDSPDIVEDNFKERILKIFNNPVNKKVQEFTVPEMYSKHFADEHYIEVSAASILAKVERDREVELLRRKYGDFGSGYPSDPKTIDFIKKQMREKKEIPGEIFRKSWNISVLQPKQKKLSEF